MSIELETIPTNKIYKLDIDTYHKFTLSGLIPRNTELIDGVIINKMTLSLKHSSIVTKLGNIINKILSNDYIVRQEKPITIKTSEPEPDISIVRGTYDDFEDSHPTTAVFVIEVAYSSLDDDLRKASIYAFANISEYWIIDLQKKEIIQFQKPKEGKYFFQKINSFNERLNIPTTTQLISLEDIY